MRKLQILGPVVFSLIALAARA
ncbi:MAG: hypothetical protein RI942_2131, partial [Pseudomonadota bacterium]